MQNYTLKSNRSVGLPVPAKPGQLPDYPANLSDESVHDLVRIYTEYTSLIAHTSLQLGLLEADHAKKKSDYDKAVTLRFVHDESKSTTERKERAKASRASITILEEVTQLQQDIFVVRALLDGYKASLFSIKTEIERRRNE